MFNWNLIIVRRTDAMRGQFVALPRRWAVERFFCLAWEFQATFQGLWAPNRYGRGIYQNYRGTPSFTRNLL